MGGSEAREATIESFQQGDTNAALIFFSGKVKCCFKAKSKAKPILFALSAAETRPGTDASPKSAKVLLNR